MDRTTGTLGRIRKLLARAERAGTPAEAQACTDKAVELMARHGIDMALLAAARAGRGRDRRHPGGGGRSLQRGQGAAARVDGLGPAVPRRAARAPGRAPPGRGRIGAVTVFGFASDRERVEVLFTSLLLQAQAQLVAQRPPHPDESVAAYRRSWLHGFAVRVHRRLVEAERRAEQRAGQGSADDPGVPGGAELVLADRRSRVEQAYAEAFPALGRGRPSVLSGSGFAAGAAAGDAADLGAGALRGRRVFGA